MAVAPQPDGGDWPAWHAPRFPAAGSGAGAGIGELPAHATSGMQHAYIGSETNDSIVSHLYASLDPAETYQGFQWVKSRG
jgi:hypothetical protein